MTDFPQPTDAILGGSPTSPLNTAAVLGGQSKYLGRLFELFNENAKLCNGHWLRWVLFDNGVADDRVAIALVRNHQRVWEADISVKYFHLYRESETSTPAFLWTNIGFLKHKGLLFGNEAEFVADKLALPWKSAIAYQVLIAKGKENTLRGN